MNREWIRTLVLIGLLLVGVGFMVWSRHAASSGLLQGLGR